VASMHAGQRRSVRPRTYGILFLLFAAVILLAHIPWLDLPYYWDEAGYYVPAALDLQHTGSLVPHSVPAEIHPPGLSAYLTAAWTLGGYHPQSTRCAMLLLAAAGVLATLLLAIELLGEARGMPGFFVVALLCLSPVFFAQSMLAQPDAPAMVLATFALWLMIRDRVAPAAAVC